MRIVNAGRRFSWRGLLAGLLLGTASTASAQPPPEPPPPPPQDDGGPAVKDSSVGYIDSAVPFSHFRLRFEAGYRERRPTRAEFFYAKGAPLGPGLPRPEPSIDYQDLSGYLEIAPTPCFSVFVETPVRFLNPEVNDNTAGYADMLAGFKYAFVSTPDFLATFQFKTYIPTGDADRGLGTHHVSLEPGLLLSKGLLDCLTLEGELRYWIPIGGTDFAGDVLRYGLGVWLGERNPDGFWATPVVEFVGWTCLSGKELVVHSPTSTTVDGAAGDTIVNVKLGVRFGYGERADVYAGYGRALTGPTWYKDIVRVEFRLLF
jgi:hypothetical protein